MFKQASPEARQWLTLARVPKVTFRQLCFWQQRFTLQQLFEQIAALSCLPGAKRLPALAELKLSEAQYRAMCAPDKATSEAIERDLSWLDQSGNYLLPVSADSYPRLLQEISRPPLLLFVSGKPELLSRPQLAMVGSRHPTPQGLENAEAFAYELSLRGYLVGSGLAQGIDGAAHRGALAGGGTTLAVLGTGTDVTYPAAHRELSQQIREQGVLVSEFFPGTPPRAKHFPRRNRILAGLSLGTLVVEAALRSGSLITARYANEQGREVFAIPGSIHNPLARGCHQLIADGAALITSVEDIEAQLSGWPLQRESLAEPPELEGSSKSGEPVSSAVAAQSDPADELSSPAQQLRDLLSRSEPTAVDTLAARSGQGIEQLLPLLLELELDGTIQSVGGGYIRARGR